MNCQDGRQKQSNECSGVPVAALVAHEDEHRSKALQAEEEAKAPQAEEEAKAPQAEEKAKAPQAEEEAKELD